MGGASAQRGDAEVQLCGASTLPHLRAHSWDISTSSKQGCRSASGDRGSQLPRTMSVESWPRPLGWVGSSVLGSRPSSTDASHKDADCPLGVASGMDSSGVVADSGPVVLPARGWQDPVRASCARPSECPGAACAGTDDGCGAAAPQHNGAGSIDTELARLGPSVPGLLAVAVRPAQEELGGGALRQVHMKVDEVTTAVDLGGATTDELIPGVKNDVVLMF